MNEYLDKTVSDIDAGKLPGWISDHVRTYQASCGEQGHLWDATAVGGTGTVPCLLVTIVGRRSGKPITHPLVYGIDDGRYVIVASKGGGDTHPQWYFNLLENPEVTVQVGSERFAATAILATGEGRVRLWSLMTAVYPTYVDYQAKTQREIPLFALKRHSGD